RKGNHQGLAPHRVALSQPPVEWLTLGGSHAEDLEVARIQHHFAGPRSNGQVECRGAAELLCLEVGVKVERYVRDARFVRAGEGVDIAFRDGGLRVGSGIGSGRAAEADHAY